MAKKEFKRTVQVVHPKANLHGQVNCTSLRTHQH